MSIFRFPSLIKLNEITLTDESRNPLEENREERSVIVELASGRKKKYIKGIRRNWNISWENVAMNSSTTVDGYASRNELRNIVQSGGTMLFEIQDGKNINEIYTVYIEEFKDSLTMRRNDEFRYNMQITVVELG